MTRIVLRWITVCAVLTGACSAPPDTRPRVVVSTDIGGSDPDDFQSMVHFLLYADKFRIEGLISSPPHAGRKAHIDTALAAYQVDFPKLKTQSVAFPSPDALAAVAKQGAIDPQAGPAPAAPTEGSHWIVQQARKPDPAPLYLLVWGSLTDVAQAVKDAPDIKARIRLYSIGSWNTRMDSNARNYLFASHPDLWWIENNTTFRGMYIGGEQTGQWSNTGFVDAHVKGSGALGELFWAKKKDIKMGDTPSVLYLLHGDPGDPSGESWGGAFVRTDHGPTYWTDNPADSLATGDKAGAKTVSKFRRAILSDWAARLAWIR